MQRNVAAAAVAGSLCYGSAFVVPGPRAEFGQGSVVTDVQQQQPQGFLSPTVEPPSGSAGLGVCGVIAAVGVGTVAARALAGRSRKPTGKGAKYVPLSSSVAPAASQAFVRDQLIAMQAHGGEEGAPGVEEADKFIAEIEGMAKTMFGGLAAGLVMLSGADGAQAYPIFAQQNYKEPEEASGKLVCANCHLAAKDIDVRMPQEVLPDTIFKVTVNIPLKYEKRYQPVADGSKAKLNAGAIAVMPEGWKLAPRDRLPKAMKKEMKGLSWSIYSKEKPNILVAGPVPGEKYPIMIMPVLAPNPATQKDVRFGKATMNFGGNRGRGQVYPEGNQSNNNQNFATTSGTVKSVDGMKITYTAKDGSEVVQEVLPGADLKLEIGEQVEKGDPISTNPNVGGFGQAEKEIVLQDMTRVYSYCAISVSIFISQLSFVLKKKQFEKVQLAEGF